MGFKCGIVGLPNVGKSTLFNALTQSNKAEAANYPFATIEPNIGRVAVPDQRLKILSKISRSKKTIPTFIDFVDIAGLVKGASKGEGLGNKFLSHIREVDTIVQVVRCFEDSNITHVSDIIDPIRDIDIIETELKLADLETLENKMISTKQKSKSGEKIYSMQIEVISDLQDKINKNISINDLDYSEEKLNFFKSLNLITSKPMLYIFNVEENSIKSGNHFTDIIKKKLELKDNNFVIVSASIESQISEFDNENDKLELLEQLGLKETTLNKVIRTGYSLLNLKTFFTSGDQETRAWTIKNGSTAQNAAGKIHSDFEKGFIRAETIAYEDFVKYNGETSSREAGKLRQEGKEYIVKDGDVMNFLFNV